MSRGIERHESHAPDILERNRTTHPRDQLRECLTRAARGHRSTARWTGVRPGGRAPVHPRSSVASSHSPGERAAREGGGEGRGTEGRGGERLKTDV